MSVQIIFVGDVMQDILISFKNQIAYGSDTQSQIKMLMGAQFKYGLTASQAKLQQYHKLLWQLVIPYQL